MDYNYLGKMLQDARNKLNIKQSDVAFKIGCTSSNISSWERGKSKIDIESLIELCKIYGIDFVEVLENANNSNLHICLDADEKKQLLIHNYDSMNKVAQTQLVEYSEFLASKQSNLKSTEQKVRVIRIARSNDSKVTEIETDISDLINAPITDEDL